MSNIMETCSLCGTRYETKPKKTKGRHHFCPRCYATHPWFPTRKYRLLCEELNIDPKLWWNEHYKY